jgi:hypothetical protein
MKLFLLLNIFLFSFGVHAKFKTCLSGFSFKGESCDSLSVTVDMSECGYSQAAPVEVQKCSEDAFVGSVKLGKKTRLVFGEGSLWGGKVTWEKLEEVPLELKSSENKSVVINIERPRRGIASDDEMKSFIQRNPAFISELIADVRTSKKTPVYWKGDLRHRSENVTKGSSDSESNYTRDRIRARIELLAEVSKYVSGSVRLATGDGGTSTNQTYAKSVVGSKNYNIKLDRAQIEMGPTENTRFKFGRMSPYLKSVGKNDALFDGDLNFDGVAAYSKGKLGNLKIMGAIGNHYLEEVQDSSGQEDSGFSISSLEGDYTFESKQKLRVKLSNYRFRGIQGHDNSFTESFDGNSNDGSVYTNGYNITSVGMEYAFAFVKASVYVEQFSNSEATDENQGYIIGFKGGSTKSKGGISYLVDYRELQADSMFGGFTDGDSYGGGANGRSTKVSFGYAIDNNVSLKATLFQGFKGIGTEDELLKRDKFQFDIKFGF